MTFSEREKAFKNLPVGQMIKCESNSNTSTGIRHEEFQGKIIKINTYLNQKYTVKLSDGTKIKTNAWSIIELI